MTAPKWYAEGEPHLLDRALDEWSRQEAERYGAWLSQQIAGHIGMALDRSAHKRQLRRMHRWMTALWTGTAGANLSMLWIGDFPFLLLNMAVAGYAAWCAHVEYRKGWRSG